MALSLTDILRKSFTDKSYDDISHRVGVNRESTKNGLHALVPVVLASVLGNNTLVSTTQPPWWNTLKDEYPYKDDDYIDTSNIDKPSFLIKGREVLTGLFLNNHDELVKSIGSVAGVPKDKSAGIIEVGVPLIIGYLTNWLRKKGWSFNDLIGNLIENKDEIMGDLPMGITPAQFGVNNRHKSDITETLKAEMPTVEKEVKKGRNGLIWIISLLVLAILLWYVLSSRACSRNMDNDALIPGAKDTISEASIHKLSMDGTYYAFERIRD